MSNGFNYDTREIIFGLKSKVGRRDDTITALNERIAVLENLVQGVSDDRDGYMERALELEQLVSRLDGALTGLRIKYEKRDREEFTGESVSALDAVMECVSAFQTVTAGDAAKGLVA